ncbi:hypothetical protein [Pseudomonas oryzicola]|uniref:Uncharacterized protein n=1 Tax=Pseudomonas oryzicola TaxID=485876 RepID=A0ABS6Q8B1_9PSED|nr:hypothetical protein [Pseudomonas oryzicola]MBV4490194.1 hypothetical protein [Pseudomonas oryzicola]
MALTPGFKNSQDITRSNGTGGIYGWAAAPGRSFGFPNEQNEPVRKTGDFP